MKIKIDKEVKGDIVFMHLSGNMLGGPDSYERMPTEFKKIIDDGFKKVIVDLEHVKRMNSTGLGILMRCYMSLKTAGGELKMTGLGETIKGILFMTKLSTVFDTYPTMDDAINSF